ncbi:cytochrome P450 724B1 isoform X1 [Fagus crenata]
MVVISPIILALSLGLVLAFLFLSFSRKKEPPNLPPGNMGWPLLGETIGFFKPHKSNSIGSFLQERCSRYGRIFKSHIFGSPTIVSCDHELNMFILQNEEKLFQVSYPKQMQCILGKYSLIIATGELHRKLKSFAVSFISTSKSSPEFLHFVEKMSLSMMDSWKTSKEVSFYKEVKAFALNITVNQLLRIEPEDPIASKILEDFETFMRGFVSLPLNFPGSAYANAMKAKARLSSYVKEMIKVREQRNVGLIEGGDFLDVLLSKKSLTNDEIVSIVLDILLGGYETTATLIALIVYFLGHAPNALEKLKEEHQGIRKSKEDGEPLKWEDYKKMEFTYNVMREAMRCGNVVKFVHREALQDVKYKDFLIPSGWKVFPIFTAASFDPSLHENPLEFNPWRWLDETTSKKVSPFGGGPRLCPGAELAKVETAYFLHHFVLNYRWKTKPDDYPLAHPYVEFRRGLLLEIQPIGKIFGRET